MRTSDEGDEPKLPGFIICDANVVIQMTIFNSKKMFEQCGYSYGALQINALTIRELKRWLNPSSAKFKKFGKDVVEIAIKKCEITSFKIQELTQNEKSKKFIAYKFIEEKLSSEQKSTDTSTEDKELLALAEKNKCYLATQETTLRSLANFVISGRLLSFEDLVTDLHTQGSLTVEEIKSGLDNLDHFQERLRGDQKRKITSLIAKKEQSKQQA